MTAEGVTVRRVERFAARSSAGFVAVAVAGVLFTLLLTLVHRAWAPLYRLDTYIADTANHAVAHHKIAVAVLSALSALGGRGMLTLVLIISSAYLLIRRQPRLAVYAAVTSLGAIALDPVVKLLVERLRPVVTEPVATAPGYSFASGHALGSIVSYGVLLLVFLPAVPKRRRRLVIGCVAALVFVIGVTRIALGVHYLTDVLGGWLLGIAWLGITAYAFRQWRVERGRTAPPVAEGLEPEAAPQIAPRAATRPSAVHALHTASVLAVSAVLTAGVLLGLGVFITGVLDHTAFGRADRGVVQWFAEHRSPTWNGVADLLSNVGNTPWVVAFALVAAGVTLAVYRSWRPVVFLISALVGEVSLFLVVSTVVSRARPPVKHLQPHLPPTSSFPSGHVAASVCLYGAIALLVWHATSNWLARAAALVVAVAFPLGIATSRLYEGAHHPTDIAGGVLLAALWLTATWFAVHPNAPRTEKERA